MTSPSAESYLSATLLNKGLRERLYDVDAVVDAITDYAIVQLDANGDVVRWCPGAQAMLGYLPAEVFDRPVSMLYIDEDRAAGAVERELAAARSSGRFEFEGWRVRKDGRRFRASMTLTPIHDETGAITGFTNVIRDLTAEHERTETMFHDLLESAPDAMVIVTSDGRIMLANAQADRMFGYRREDLIGREVEILIPQRFRDAHKGLRSSFFAYPAPRRMGIGLQLWGVDCNGNEFPVEVSLSPMRTTHGVLVSAAMRDMTQQLAIQSELAQARTEAEIFAERDRIAGELQDHAIQRVFAVGLALQSTIPRVRSTEVQQRLNDAVDDLHGVVQDFRTAIFGLRRKPSDSMGLRHRLDEIIGQLSGDLATTVQYKGPLSVVEGPLAEHAESVVAEAIKNAVLHAHATKLSIAIDVADELCIDVVDNGRGIPDDINGSGLISLRQRAEAVGGTFTVGAGPDGGVRLRWAAPLH